MRVYITKSFYKIFLLFACSLFVCNSCNAVEKKEIKASEIIKQLKKDKHVHIIDKIILDDLDFTEIDREFAVSAGMLQNEINSNIFFSKCVFMGKITTTGKQSDVPVQSVFKNNVSFIACDFRGDVDFSNTVIFGTINFSQSVFRENAVFDNISVWAKDSYFTEIKAEKNFSMIYASFYGNLYFVNTEFSGRFSMQETSVGGKLSFNSSTFNGRAGFDLLTISKKAFFNYVTFEEGADFSFSYFMQSTEFINTTWKKKGLFEKTFFNNDDVNFGDTD